MSKEYYQGGYKHLAAKTHPARWLPHNVSLWYQWYQQCSSSKFHRLYQNHPHVYGEHKLVVAFGAAILESSPCIWGAPISNIVGQISFRIIPMYMGSTMLEKDFSNLTENHPHVYGEHTKKSLYIGIFKLQGCRFLLTSLLKTT